MVRDLSTPLIAPDWRPAELDAAIGGMILSASGWRAVFAADQDEESDTTEVAPEHLAIAGLAAAVFAEHIGAGSVVAVGTDTRPTGPRIALAAMTALLERGIRVHYLGVSASPEIMAYAGGHPDLDGFFYISASHNPIGHNGIKMGGSNGGVLDGETARSLIDRFRELAADPAEVTGVVEPMMRPAAPAVVDAVAARESHKKYALDNYRRFTASTAAGPGPSAERAMAGFAERVSVEHPGLVVDFNGSARTVSVDVRYLEELGCTVRSMNNQPGEIAHIIVPEGAGLEPCRVMLEQCAAEDEHFVLGYVPDNDGDRGNLVASTGDTVRALEAQEVFALACVAELCWLEYTGAIAADSLPVAVAVNGPTSLRVERIASAFGAEVTRSEVGEANVVNLARELRASGRLVRILGEGSNGGNITHPSAVRDPLQTVLAILKLIMSPALGDTPPPLEIWSRRSGVAIDPAQNRTPSQRLRWLVDSLPSFTTTNAFSEAAKLTIRSTDHAALKRAFERLLPDAVPDVMPMLRSELGAVTWDIVNYEGTTARPGPGNRTGRERGGLKLRFLDGDGVERGFAWMRGSGTEPVFRVLVDVEGARTRLHDTVLDWLRSLVMKADALVQ
jgi:phosphoglucomutase